MIQISRSRGFGGTVDLGGHRVVHLRRGGIMVTVIVTRLAELRDGQPAP